MRVSVLNGPLLTLCLLVVPTMFVAAPGVSAQVPAATAQAPAVAAHAPAASPSLPPGHWARAALERLDALGLAGAAFDPGAGSLTRQEAARRFAAAAAAAEARGKPELERLAAGYLHRFEEEFGARDDAAHPRLLRGSVAGGVTGSRGLLLAGYDRDAARFAPSPLPARTTAVGGAVVAAALSRGVALVAEPSFDMDAVRLDAAYLPLAAGRVRGWVGRRPVGFGAEAGGSIVLGDAVAFDGAGIELDSARLPWLLRALGPVRAEAFGARLHAAGAVEHPWFLAMRLWARPHPRLWVAATRAASVGGQGNTAYRARDVPLFLVGMAGGAHGETENQVASLEARWRAPVGALPLVVYGEWAFDDMGYSYFHVPGITLGMQLPAVPALPALSLGLERTSFAGHCCGNPPWYRHSALPWMERRVPLGHPLGGNGTQWLAYGRADMLDARLRLDVQAFHRFRGPENLFSPTRQGRSMGGEVGVEWVVSPALEGYAEAGGEWGRGWREEEVRAGVRVRY